VARAIDRLHARGSRPAAPCATAVPSLGRERPPRRGQGVDARLFSARALGGMKPGRFAFSSVGARRHGAQALRVLERARSAASRVGARWCGVWARIPLPLASELCGRSPSGAICASRPSPCGAARW
jgi:hypothetical protein